MRKKGKMLKLLLAGILVLPAGALLSGCGEKDSGKIEIELVQYKQEAVDHTFCQS